MGQVLAWTDATTAPEDGQTTTITVLKPDGVTVLAVHSGLTGTSFDVPDASFGSEPIVILRTSSERIDADGTFESLQSFDHWVIVGFVSGAEADAGVGSFSGAGSSIRAAALSGSGLAALSATGIANNAGAFSGSGTGALAETGAQVLGGALSGSGTGALAAIADNVAVSRRYLRIRITAGQAGASNPYAFSQLTCHETVGGADVLTGSGATITTTNQSGSEPLSNPAKLVDGNDATYYASNGTPGTVDLVIDWGAGAGKNIAEVGVKGRNDGSALQTPYSFEFAYSADNITFTTDWSAPAFMLEQYVSGTIFPLQKMRRTSLFPATSPNRRIWGIRWNASPASFAELAQLELRATVGGASMTGGKAVCSAFFSTAFPPNLAFDGTSSQWAATSIAKSYLGRDFLEGNEKAKPAQIAIKASGIPSRAPTDFDLWYQDGVGGAVTIVQNFTTPATWTAGEVRTFTT